MPYFSKLTLRLMFFCLPGVTLSGQTKEDYKRFLDNGIAAYQNQSFDPAIKQLKAAKAIINSEEVNDWIEKVNNGYIFFPG